MSVLSASDLAFFTGAFAQHFSTFARLEPIVIFKEPQQVITQSNLPVYAGYGVNSTSSITYVPVSGLYSGIIRYKQNMDEAIFQDLQTRDFKGEAMIKVEENAKNFIKNGKTELFQFDGKSFNQIVDESVQEYFGLKYYYFGLSNTN